MPATVGSRFLCAALTLLIVLLAACGDSSDDPCGEAERQVAECMDRLCAGDEDGPFCGCHEAGQHLPADRSCTCATGSVWDEMRESVCEELDDAPALDCEGLMATVRRFERFEGCE
jgi:hypothetical protein